MIIEEIFGKKKWTDSETLILDFIENNAKIVINLSLEELSSHCYVSQASVIRLCKKLGMKGYSDFRVALASKLASFVFVDEKIHVDIPLKENDSTEMIASTFLNLTHQSLEKAYSNININDIDAAASLITNADIVYIYGRGESLIVAEDFHYKLLRIGKLSVLETPNGFQEAMCVNQTGKVKSAALVISQYCNSRQVNYVIDELMANRVPYILLTAAEKPWPYDYFSKVTLKVQESESRYKMGSFSSRTSMLFTLDCLYGKIFSLDYKKNNENLAQFSKRKVERDYFYNSKNNGTLD